MHATIAPLVSSSKRFILKDIIVVLAQRDIIEVRIFTPGASWLLHVAGATAFLIKDFVLRVFWPILWGTRNVSTFYHGYRRFSIVWNPRNRFSLFLGTAVHLLKKIVFANISKPSCIHINWMCLTLVPKRIKKYFLPIFWISVSFLEVYHGVEYLAIAFIRGITIAIALFIKTKVCPGLGFKFFQFLIFLFFVGWMLLEFF